VLEMEENREKKKKKSPQVCRWLTIGKPEKIGPARPRYADGHGHRQKKFVK